MLFLFLHFLSYIPDRNLIIFLELTYGKSFYLKSQQATCLFMLIKVNSISKKKKTNKQELLSFQPIPMLTLSTTFPP